MERHRRGPDRSKEGQQVDAVLRSSALLNSSFALADQATFADEQAMQAVECHRCGPDPPKRREQGHAALRPNNLLSRPFLLFGMVIATVSPESRLAASV